MIALWLVGLGCSGPGPAETGGEPWERSEVPVETTAVTLDGLVVYVEWPGDRTGTRFPEGAPVAVKVAGGSRPDVGSVPSGDGFASLGVVTLGFLFPGATHEGLTSAGVFDYRGPVAAAALAEVLAFARDEVASSEGTLSEIVGYPVLDVGIEARSQGGNLVPHALALDGGPVAWVITWESPTLPEHVTFELGRTATNPYYTQGSCAVAGCEIDYATLALDRSAPFAVPDVRLPGVMVELPGTVFFDADGSGTWQEGEWVVGPYAARLGETMRVYFSPALSAALGDVGGVVASPDSAQAFWRARAGATAGGGSAWAGDVPVLVLGSERDHAQATPDHAHLAVQIEAVDGTWVRLNPDAAYLGGGPDAPANLPWSYEVIAEALLPEALEPASFSAAVREMADRAHDDAWDDDLEEALW